MNVPLFSSSHMLAITFVFFALLQGVCSEKIIAEKFGPNRWPDQYGCKDLQLNLTAQSIITDEKLYLFGNINDYVDGNVTLDIEILIGAIDLKNAFTIDHYEVEWRTSQNFTFQFAFLSGDESLLTFSGQQRSKYNVLNASDSFITYEPSSYGLETIEWPSTVPEHSLPVLCQAVVNVPEWKMTYYAGLQPTTAQDYHHNELFAYNYSTGVMERFAAPDKIWSAATFVPVGEAGMLVMLGGIERMSIELSSLPMDEIHVYDITSQSWYLQPTTGKTPSPRDHICTVITYAKDRSSYQIHVYGGHRPGDDDYAPIVDNYYILSIPQFVWTKGSNVPGPRLWAGCNLLGKHRMAITAGFTEVGSGCVDLIQILDLNTGNLTESFGVKDESAYLVPSNVLEEIGGGPEGGATLNYPVKGLVAGLAEAYKIRYIGDPLPASPTPTTVVQEEAPKKKPLGAIIGGALGGVAAGAIILGLFLYCRQQSKHEVEDEPTAPTNEASTYPDSIYASPPYTEPTYIEPTPMSPTHTIPESPTPTYMTPHYPSRTESHNESGIEAPSSPVHELPTKLPELSEKL